MKEAGRLVEWNDDRGFGFVQSATGERLFVHISAFAHPARRPEIGDRVAFSRGPGKDGRPAAVTAQIAGLNRPPVSTGPSVERVENAQRARAFRLLGAAVLIGMLIVLGLPRLVLWIYLGMGALSFVVYWLDKRAALAGRWRTPEANLHGLDLLGGIVGGLLAQAALHHKTAKPGFAAVTGGIVLLHVALLATLAYLGSGMAFA